MKLKPEKVALVVLSVAQNFNRDPKTAAIISEQRYQTGNGQFGAAYTQEDGIAFKEETDANGDRHGQYSYVDPSGVTRKVTYTAGKNGFQATGDHLPVAPEAPATPQPQYQPQSQYQQQPQQQQQQQPRQQEYNQYDTSSQFDDGSYDERWNNPTYSGNGAASGRLSAPAPVHRPAAPVPAPPQYNNYQYQQEAPQKQEQQQQYQQQQYQQPQQQQQYQQPQQQQQQYQQQPQQQYETTPNPHRFQPPGKLSLNRTPDGFSYSFNKA
ncbi:unnamed protein product [Diamesa serratosioi]